MDAGALSRPLRCLRRTALFAAAGLIVLGGSAQAGSKMASSTGGPAACLSPKALAAEREFSAMIDAAAVQFVVRPSFLRAVVACESSFNSLAESRAGARGLAQVMPSTARGLGVHPDLLWDARVNLYSAAKYIRLLVERYGNNIDAVLIAYNAGPSYIETGKPLPRETVEYLARVKSAYRAFLIRAQLAAR
jgi:soluble lytic murein transglycosylase-like protein